MSALDSMELKDFTEAWDRQLKAEGISYWKSSEYRGLDGLGAPLAHLVKRASSCRVAIYSPPQQKCQVVR
jgi:hypothetical protein